MTRRITRLLIAAAISIAAVAAPSAASASTIYPPAGSCTTSPATMTAGSTVTFACSGGTSTCAAIVAPFMTSEKNKAGKKKRGRENLHSIFFDQRTH